MGMFKLINPVITGSFEDQYEASTPEAAAKKFWDALTSDGKYVTGNVPRFMFTLQDLSSEKLHHFLVGIIEKGLKVLGMKDSNAIHKTANIIFHVVIASLMIASGLGAYKAVKSANLSHATLEGALTAVKNGEVSKFIAKELGGLAKVAPEAGTLATTALGTTA